MNSKYNLLLLQNHLSQFQLKRLQNQQNLLRKHMNFEGFDVYSPISDRHANDQNKDLSFSSTWNNIIHPSTIQKSYTTLDKQMKINYLIARNKMARNLDCIYAKRVRYPFQIMKQKILFSESDISKETSKCSFTKKKPLARKIKIGVEILQDILTSLEQKTKIQGLAFLKSISDQQHYQHPDTNPPSQNWLRKQQLKEGASLIFQFLSKKAKRDLDDFWKNLIYFGNCKSDHIEKIALQNTKFQSTIIQQKRNLSYRQQSQQKIRKGEKLSMIYSSRDVRPLKQQKNNRDQQRSEKIVQYVCVMKERSNSKSSRLYGSKQRMIRVPLRREMSDGRQMDVLDMAERRGSKIRLSKQKDYNFFRTSSSKSKGNCNCCDENVRPSSTMIVTSCKYCKLFMDSIYKPQTSVTRPSKYNFFGK